MRVVIVGGRTRTDYLMSALAEAADEVVVINNDRLFCEYLSSRHDSTVIWGDGMKRSVLEEADVEGFDAIVALTRYDADNLAICQVAKKFLGIPLQLCIVSNPENTKIFRQLGVTAAISATAALADAIRDTMGTLSSEMPKSIPFSAPEIDSDEGEFASPYLFGSWHRLKNE